MDTAGATVIAATGLTKIFGTGDRQVRAVDGIDLDIPAGEIVAFLGPNGAGKTTALDMMLGLTTPDAGEVIVCGLAPRQAVLAGKVSAVLQTGGLLNDLTVGETVRLVASMFDRPRPDADVLERAGIAELAGRRVSKCSGGEQQRLRFALALLPDPDLLILDEPTAGLDVAARQDFWATMRADADSGRTIVFATHYLHEADSFAERIVLIDAGRIVADGPVEQIRARGAARSITVDIPAAPDGAAPGGAVPADRATGRAADDWLARVRDLPGVGVVTRRGNRATISAADTDAVALILLRDLGGTNLEITPATLDSAFLALTGKGSQA